MFFNQLKEKGFAAFFITIMVSSIILSISASIFVLNYSEQIIALNVIKSKQAYYSAEAGIEDALLRLRKDMKWSNPVVLNVGGILATTTVLEGLGGTKIITSEGRDSNVIKKIQTVFQISADNISFFYGAQVGDGGIELDDLSAIDGNIFSNGSVIGENNNTITGTAKIAKKGNKIDELRILGDAYADICEDSNVSGTLYAFASTGCAAAQFIPLMGEIATISLPIFQSQIDKWKNDAAAGGVYSGNYSLDNGTAFLGPKKIQGNLTVENNARIFLAGTVWVTGNVNIKNNAIVRLDQDTYNALGGIIVSDGLIKLENNSISSGSGDAGSYLMYLSAATLDPAIIMANNATADILYASNGWIEIQNNNLLREITGYGVRLKNNARINYETGLLDTSFFSGSGGGWEVTSWKEIE